MLIISTRPVAEIIHAVSAALIAGSAPCASACAGTSATRATDDEVRIRRFESFASISQSVGIGFPRPDAHRAFDRRDEDLSVADLPGLGRLANGVDHPLGPGIVDRNL